MKKLSWVIVYSFMFGFLFFMIIAPLVSNRMEPAAVVCNDYFVEFDGLIYDQIPYSNIRSIDYIRNGEIRRSGKLDGLEYKNYVCGHTKVIGYGKCDVFYYISNPNFIVLKTKDKTILYNEKSATETEKMFDEILAHIPKRSEESKNE